ncbi:uncharacterized protein N7459_000914 [Penicillium hispanicum]|uniref:uncharacterized protein n=1 Tax=Penicillium hispanicum TaxID=1080232 RepID=UPI0025414B63|nr:uncharacterized protein N7459_000914 [Penicillium hispanicum]KAJ5594706.1 hypothetical protein N7459_000914 [Penicillium hispanicum]
MNELAKLAADSVGAEECIQVEKFPDGMFNKSFLFTMGNGAQVVGKVPNPNAGQAHYTTASEVATMDFMRNILGTPVPRVLAWCSKAKQTSVGAEYIIMEKAEGAQLSNFWPGMEIESRLEIVKAMSRYQKSWMSTSFTKYGSLYYSPDLTHNAECFLVNTHGIPTKEPRFAIGPSTGRDQVDHSRIGIDFDRGPWDSALQYRRAVGFREIACIQNIAELPRSPVTLCGPRTYCPSRSKKLDAVHSYLQLVQYLLPTNQSIAAPFLWHGDLHTENIFVNPECPTEILGIIDWQSTEILPLFDHARQPCFLDYDGPQINSLRPPDYPKNLDKLSLAEQHEAKSLYFKMSLSALYKTLISLDNPTLYKAMEFRQTRCFDLLLLAQNLLVDGEALYRATVMELEEEWSNIPSVQAFGYPPFPLQLSASEIQSLENDVAGAIRGMELLGELKESLGDFWPEKGIVRHDQYDQTKALLRKAKPKVLDQLACCGQERTVSDNLWPFDN